MTVSPTARRAENVAVLAGCEPLDGVLVVACQIDGPVVRWQREGLC